MTLPATDAFTAADGTALQTYSASWTINAGGFAINTNAVYSNGSSAECGAGWNADTFDAGQYATGTITAISSIPIGVAVRAATSGGTYIGFYADSGACYLFKQVSDSWTQLGSSAGSFTTSDVIRLEVTGTAPSITITPKKNGSTTGTPGQQIDGTAALNSGRAGLSGYGAGTGTRLDNWEGGNLGVTTPSVNVSDSTTLSESKTASVSTSNVNKSDSASLADTPTVVVTTRPIVTDSIGTAESIAVLRSGSLVSVSDTVSVAESAVAVLSESDIAVSDSGTLSETSLVILNDLLVATDDSASLSESVSLGLSSSPISVSDEIASSDSASVAFESITDLSINIAVDNLAQWIQGVRIY